MSPLADTPIVICFDGSDAAAAAIAAAAELFPGRRAVVVEVSPLVRSGRMSAEVAEDIERFDLGEAQSVAEAGAELARKAGFDVEARARLDTSTWRGVAEIADDVDAAAIVLGSHGRTGPPHPSLPDELVSHAGRPIVVVPQRA